MSGERGQIERKPLVVSLCGTFLKLEMRSLYRQVTGLQRHNTVVFTEQHIHAELFPFEPVVVMEKRRRPRPRGNFILRFWYKYVVKQWPPPRPIAKQVRPYYPYNLPDLLAEHRPDLVHVYYGHKAVKYREMLAAWGGPWIVSFHGVDVVKFFDRPGYAEEMARVFDEARLVLARSESLLVRLRELGCPEEKLRLNRTPIPMEGFPFRERQEPADGQVRLVQASRLVAKKGLFTTLKALEHLRAEWPKLRFVLCGDGPVKEQFQQAVAAAGLGEMVEMRGWLDGSPLLEAYHEADIFLHPSEMTETEDQEGVPNSLLEAMATGLPVVATRHGGIPEAVRDGTDGILVAEKDPAALAAAIDRLLRNTTLRRKMGRAAADGVRERFASESAIATMEDSYTEAAGETQE